MEMMGMMEGGCSFVGTMTEEVEGAANFFHFFL
jgi:hypothetical protein